MNKIEFEWQRTVLKKLHKNCPPTVLSIVPLELWLERCLQSYSFFPVTHKNFLAYYICVGFGKKRIVTMRCQQS
jgi:hypothetical protein